MSNFTSESGSFFTGTAEVQPQEFLEHSFGANCSVESSASANNDSLSTITNDDGQQQQVPQVKMERSLPVNPDENADPSAEVIALSPTTLMESDRFVCEICNKGFQRDQNLQLHQRGHNLPWKLKQRRSTKICKRVFVCPEPSCVHHNPARGLSDLKGIKKHFCSKHGHQKWKNEKFHEPTRLHHDPKL